MLLLFLLSFTMDNFYLFSFFLTLNVVNQLCLEIWNYFLPVLLRLFMCMCLYFLSELKFKR